jgi:hypothetical protein
MKIFLCSVFFTIIAVCSFAQTDIAGKYASVITATDLQAQLNIIASEQMEGRETGTQGQRKAAAYIQDQFKKIGLKEPASLKDYQQLYPLQQDTLAKSSIKVNGMIAKYGEDFISLISANQTQNIQNKKIIFIGYGIDDSLYSDYKNKDVKDKIVVFFSGEPKQNDNYIISGSSFMSDWSYSLLKKIKTAKQKGAAAAFVINISQESFTQKEIDQSLKTKLSFKNISNFIPVNYCILSHAFAEKIIGEKFGELLSKAKDQQPFRKRNSLFRGMKASYVYEKNRTVINSSNVIGFVEGTDKKDEYVFVTAHYDHLGTHDGKIFYGADDDGSGTCGVLEMAKAFAKAASDGYRPRRTVVLMTVSGEEKGLWGSEYYSEHPVFQTEKTSADLNIDMVGRIDTERKTADTLNYVYVIGHDKISSDLPVINEGINSKYTHLTLDYKFDDPLDKERIYYRSDHYNFARKGIPVLFFYDGMLLGDYHKPTDTVDKIYWDVYEKRVRMIFLTAWEIANRDEMLKRDKPLSD